MKRQINQIMVVFLAVFFLSANVFSKEVMRSGARGPETPAWSKTAPKSEKAPAQQCTEVTESDIHREINVLPEPLKKQFRDGNITFSYANQKLVFKGYISGNVINVSILLTAMEKWRGEKCIRVVSFEGITEAEDFEWRSEITPPAPDKCDIGDAIDKVVGAQLNQTFFYNLPSPGVLEFRGHIGDAPGRGRFTSLMARLQQFTQKGCISKIIFKPRGSANQSGKLWKADGETGFTKIGFTRSTNEFSKWFTSGGFEWQVCEHPYCECAGVCKLCSDPC